jgi:hypothetical protein
MRLRQCGPPLHHLTYVTNAKLYENNSYVFLLLIKDRLCGLVFRVPGYRSRGPGLDSRRHQIFWEVVGLEWGSLGLVRIIE